MAKRLQGTTLKTDIFQEIQKDEVKAKVDIVSLFQSFGVQLEKKGQSYMGLCPFHDDKTPSLSVSKEKGLFNCFGCGESGDVFDVVMKIKGFSFAETLTYLQGNSRTTETAPKKVNGTKKEVPKAKPPEKAEPVEPGISPNPVEPSITPSPVELGITLDEVAEFYHKELYSCPEAMSYLEGRGITNKELYKRFKLGFASGGLKDKISDSQHDYLQTLGVYSPKKKGYELMSGCITVSLLDGQGKVKGMYGRSISDSSFNHRYFAGGHHGLFNANAAKVYRDELILTESIIDALSLLQLGIENVVPCYGTNGLTDLHLNLFKDHRVETVVLAFDGDEAGQKGVERATKTLVSQGISVKQIIPSAGKDWNEFLTSGGTADQVKALCAEVTPMEPEEPQEQLQVEKKGLEYVFTLGNAVYRLLGVKEGFVSSLKVNITVEKEGKRFPDNADLYSARSRASFASLLSSRMEIPEAKIEDDLLRILAYLEKKRDESLSLGEEKPYELSEEERRLGMELLTSSDLMDRIVHDFESLGHVGETYNKQIVYLAAVSRLFPKPLNIYVQAGSSGGKTYLLDTVKELIPPESVISVTSFSDQSLNYMNQADFTGKVMIMGEDIHNETIQGQVRQMQSEGLIARMVTTKDPKTGILTSKIVHTKVQMSFMLSSTALYLNPENASRCLVLHVDESAGQTELVQEAQREKRTAAGYMKLKHYRSEIIAAHHAAGRLLEYVPVFNPLAVYIRFPKSRPTMRRSQEHFLTLLDVVCLLRQFQKERVTTENPYTKGVIEGIEVDISDYRIAYELFTHGVLLPNANELPTGAKLLYESIRTLIREKAKEQQVEPTDMSVIQREIRETSQLGSDSVKKYIRALVDYEYLQIVSGNRHGTRYSYRLRQDKGVEELDVSVIPTPQAIEEAMKAGGTV